MKKLFTLLLTLVLLGSMTLGVFANETPHTITITNPDAQEAHAYTAYQVFSGDYDPNSGVLANVKWGSGVNGLAVLEGLRANIPAFADCETAAQTVQVLATVGSDSDELRAFAAIVDRYTTTPAGSGTATAETPARIGVAGDGYYYVKDTTEALVLDTYSDYILLVEGDVTVAAKDTAGVTSQKKVKDINDSTQEGSDWQDSADYDIGDPIPFQLLGTVASDYDKYNSYKLVFHDRESTGLTFDHISGVFVDGTEIAGGWELSLNPEDRCVFDVIFTDLKTIPEVKGGSVITVEYVSILNEEAVIGVPGNPNEMKMEYSNNPTDETSTGFTTWDKVVVFTYEVIVDKVDENGEKLPGAQFQLEKWDEAKGEWVIVPGEVAEAEENGLGRVLSINGKPVRYYTAEDGTQYIKLRDKPNEEADEADIYLKVSDIETFASIIANGTSVGVGYYEYINGVITKVAGNFSYAISALDRAATDGATFTWKGVDDGRYRITETVTPPGYNTMDPIEFWVYADHEVDSEDPQLIWVDGNPFIPTEENMGILHADVINTSGGLLPSTGGIGATIFYALGGFLILAVGVAAVVRKKSEE